jgi:ketosteroid isomerase-like protein
MTHPNEDLIRAGFAAYGRGDLTALQRDYFAPDITWHFPGRSDFAGDHVGVDAVAGLFVQLGTRSGGTHRIELHDVIANDDHVVALHTTRAERGEKKLEVNAIQVFHVQDGKVTEAWTHHGDLYGFDNFWD